MTRKANVHLAAATHRHLEEMMRENLFRSDLYYRPNVFPIYIPPLSECPKDIPPLVHEQEHRNDWERNIMDRMLVVVFGNKVKAYEGKQALLLSLGGTAGEME